MASTKKLCTTEEIDIVKTFECGQCFRWNADDNGVYTGVVRGYAAKVWVEGDSVMIRSAAPDALWHDYFDLSRDYAAAAAALHGGEYLDECIAYGRGIRILRQEPWEALCSFIISQCNNISRIKGIVERLCAAFGYPVELDGVVYRSFPSAETLAFADPGALDVLRCGYRAPYILSAAQAVASGALDFRPLIDGDSDSARMRLKQLDGVGDKVANCVVLFGLYHMEAFPIDVWIKRALKEHFPPDFDPAVLGEYAGLAQQYIFFHARSTGL